MVRVKTLMFEIEADTAEDAVKIMKELHRQEIKTLEIQNKVEMQMEVIYEKDGCCPICGSLDLDDTDRPHMVKCINCQHEFPLM